MPSCARMDHSAMEYDIKTIMNIWDSIWFILGDSTTSTVNYDDAHAGAPLARAVVTWLGQLAHDVGAKRPDVRRCGKLCGSILRKASFAEVYVDFPELESR